MNQEQDPGFDRFSNHPYHSPTPGRLPMIAYLPNKAPEPLEEEMCENMNTCGINSAITSVGIYKIKESMRKAANKGITSIVMHAHLLPSSTNDVDTQILWCGELLDSLKNESGLGGYIQSRYPNVALLPKLTPFIRKIGGTTPGDEKAPSFSSPLIVTMLSEQSEVPLIERCDDDKPNHYLPYVQQCLGPGVWWSDSTAWYVDTDGNKLPRYREFFNNLRIMDMMSVSTNRPFWSSVKCVTADYADLLLSPKLSPDGGMLFSAMSALAYGAQGLVFTNFRQTDETFSDGSVPMPTWEYVSPVIERIRKHEGVFLGAEAIRTEHWTETSYPPILQLKRENDEDDISMFTRLDKEMKRYLYTKMETPIGPLKRITFSNNCSHTGLIVSHLSLMPEHSMLSLKSRGGQLLGNKEFSEEAEALDFLVIVNQDVNHASTFRMTLDPYYQIMEVTEARIQSTLDHSKNVLKEQKLTLNSETYIERTLPPGDALVLRWK